MSTPLMRKSLPELYKAACDQHAGLLLQRGWEAHAKEEAKTKHIQKICNVSTSCLYRNAFRRWKDATADQQRFSQITLRLESRLFIGTAGEGALEIGCAISHSYGMPYIPGSSVKGVVGARARQRFGSKGDEGRAVCRELFGSEPTQHHPAGLAGLIGFHDVWWVPDSAESPLVAEVVTSHHKEYYGTGGQCPATDWDSPVPNAQVAVQGDFFFVMEGPNAWLGLACEILTDALHTRGIGAKTRAGYGFFLCDAIVKPEPTCNWVDDAVEALMKEHRASKDDTLRGRPLAGRWAEIEDLDLKREAFEDIRRRWQKEGWWDSPPSRAARSTKAIYLPPDTES